MVFGFELIELSGEISSDDPLGVREESFDENEVGSGASGWPHEF